MAQGRRQRSTAQSAVSVSENPQVVVNQELVDDEEMSTNESDSDSHDPNWQLTELYSIRTSPVTRQLNIPSAPLRRYQIAQALSWQLNEVAADYVLADPPQDADPSTQIRLIRHRDDTVSESAMVLVLIDSVIHPPPSKLGISDRP